MGEVIDRRSAIRGGLALRGAFAPTAAFACDPANLDGGALTGFAAPDGGPDPCLVELVCGGETLSMARAVGYSHSAAEGGLRLGWCAFVLGGLTSARSPEEAVEIRCALTARTLAAFSPRDLAGRSDRERERTTVLGLRSFLGRLYGCLDVEQIRPFYEPFIAANTIRDCVKAAYEYFLRRTPSEIEIEGLAPHVPHPLTMDWIARLFIECDEFKAGPGFPLPGPFDPGFPFDRGVLETPPRA